jgi:pimeloyl-ACP methyl ester carboxylesterase
MPTLEARGIEIVWSERGEGPAILLVHETAASGAVWDAVREALAPRARAITYDRRGWGASTAPEGYRRTMVEEQSEDAAALLESAKAAPAVVVGAGIGAIVALDLLLRRADLVTGTLLVEPPVLQLLPMATEALSGDRRRLEIAAGTGASAIDLYLSGGLQALGGGVDRLPAELIAAARERPASVIAEMGIATEWRVPLPSLGSAERPSTIVTAPSTPPLLRDAAARSPPDSPEAPPGGGLGSGCAACRRAAGHRPAGARAQSVAGSGSASISITPPRRPTPRRSPAGPR